jgi:phage gp45-like
MKTVEQLAQVTDPALVRAYGAIRRFVVTLTDSARWQIAGVLMPDGREAHRAEVFSGVGFYSRPPADVQTEAVVVMSGDASNQLVVAVRDEKTRAAVVGDLKADESAIYNSVALVYVKADGTIEARSKSGTALRLMTVADGLALVDAIRDAATVANDGGASFKAALLTSLANWPTGTTKLKGE